jgi:methionyl-tRNA formyltransferase
MREVHDHIRALSPSPGAWCEVPVAGRLERLKVLRSVEVDGSAEPGVLIDNELIVACREKAVRLIEVQRAGGRPTTSAEFLRGVRLEKGMSIS